VYKVTVTLYTSKNFCRILETAAIFHHLPTKKITINNFLPTKKMIFFVFCQRMKYNLTNEKKSHGRIN